MSPLRTAFIAELATVLFTSAWQYHHRQSRAQEAAGLRVQNDQLRLQASQRHEAEIFKTHQGDGMIASLASSVSHRQHSLSSVPAIAPAAGISRSAGTDYRNEGQTTPVNTLQTLAWACDHGDAILMAKLILFDADARRRAMDYLASRSPEIRAQWPSPEAMAVALYLSDGLHSPYPDAKLLQKARFEQITPTRVVAHLPGANGDGYEYQQTSQGWKLAITEAVVSGHISEASQSRR